YPRGHATDSKEPTKGSKVPVRKYPGRQRTYAEVLKSKQALVEKKRGRSAEDDNTPPLNVGTE
ncbi:hypothetical protein Ancab_014333, partial [Ancistrocladus abbreviatus]